MACKAKTIASILAWAALAMLTAGGAAAPAPVSKVAGADNAFGFRLLNAVQKEHPHANVVLSPVSAALDFAMALNGASGETAAAMTRALSLDGMSLAQVNEQNAGLIKTLRSPVKDVTLSVADSLWTDSRRVALKPDYVSQTRRWYDATVENIDFNSPTAPAKINAWASKETHGRIPVVLEKIDPLEVAVLLNAVYFKGLWTHKFDKAHTHEAKFTLQNGSSKTLRRMAQSGKFDYFETNDVQAIRLPYGKGDLAMDVFLPSHASSLAKLESALTPQLWTSWQAKFSRQQGTIELPRFELKNKYNLNGPLRSLGMARAFDADRAQFAKMTSSRVFISSAHQLSYLKVDEEGTEAAAVTSIEMHVTAVMVQPSPFSMIVDRPFLCAIEDRRTGALLFIGAIYDPIE